MQTTDDNMNIPTPRRDEKRSSLFAVLIMVVGVFFITVGFLVLNRPDGKAFSDYQFNRAVVTNNDDALENKPATAPAPGKKDEKKSQPSKPKKKDADYCPT